jgi:hypothetical protein
MNHYEITEDDKCITAIKKNTDAKLVTVEELQEKLKNPGKFIN